MEAKTLLSILIPILVSRDVTKREHPVTFRPLLPEIEEFAKHNHFDVLFPILRCVLRISVQAFINAISGRLLALGLELPEDTFVNIHGFEDASETYGMIPSFKTWKPLIEAPLNYSCRRSAAHEVVSTWFVSCAVLLMMIYSYPRSEEEELKTNNVWLKGHTGSRMSSLYNSGFKHWSNANADFGSITILWSQSVAALQILSPDGKWRWIKHIDNALVISKYDIYRVLF